MVIVIVFSCVKILINMTYIYRQGPKSKNGIKIQVLHWCYTHNWPETLDGKHTKQCLDVMMIYPKRTSQKANRKKKICGLSHSQKLLSVTCVLILTFGDGRFIAMSWRKLIASRHISQTTRQPVTLLNVERKKFLKSITCNCRYHHNYSGILSIQFKVC